MPFRLITGILGLALLCTGCGFQLRNNVELPPQMAKTQMVVDDEYSTLARRVRVMLEQNGVQFVNANEATAILEIPVNNVVTDVLTIGDNARVREYRISHTVRFRLLDAQGQVLVGWQNMRQAREISFDEQRILAGSREQEYLKEDLAETLSRLLIARLESAPVGSVPDGCQRGSTSRTSRKVPGAGIPGCRSRAVIGAGKSGPDHQGRTGARICRTDRI